MTAYYLDTSVAAHALLRTSRNAVRWLEEISVDVTVSLIGSRLIRTELTRVLRREGLPVGLRSAILDRLDLVPLTEGVLAGAESIVPRLRTLDAIHLASAVATGLDLVVVTHDARMGEVARELGYDVLDPVTSEASR